MSKAAVASTVGKQAVKKGRPALKKSVELIRENEEEIKEVHRILKETGAYEKMLEKALDRMERGEEISGMINKFENKELEELQEFEVAIQEMQDIIRNEEQVYEYAGRVISIIASVEKSHESEEEDIEAHIKRFEDTRDAKHLETAFKEEIDAIETLHEETELATNAAEVIERATQQVLEIEELEEIESNEAAEQNKIFQKEGNLFMKAGEKEFLNRVKSEQEQEQDQLNTEKTETKQIVKMDRKEIKQLEQELERMLEEAERDRKNVGRILQSYKQSSMNFQNSDRFVQRLEEAEEMLEQDIRNIENAQDLLKNQKPA